MVVQCCLGCSWWCVVTMGWECAVTATIAEAAACSEKIWARAQRRLLVAGKFYYFTMPFLPTIGSGIGKNLKYENWNSTLRDNFCSERQWHLAVSKINNQFSLRILVLTQPFLQISKIIRLDSLLLPPIIESPQRNDRYQWNLMNWLHMYLGELDGSYCTWV